MSAAPADITTLLEQAADLQSRQRDIEATAALQQALAIDPNSFDARSGLFQIAFAQNRVSEALEHLLAFPAAMHADFQWLAHHATLLGKLGDHEGEILLLRRLMEMEPTVASLWVSMAYALKTLGRTDEAVDSLRQAIVIQPTYGKPWWLLSDLKNFRFTPADIAAVEHLLASGLSLGDRISLHFAMAKALEDSGQATKAFGHYAEGNHLRASTIGKAEPLITRRVDRSIALYTAEFLAERQGSGSLSTAPIFIVGMPRSGSTLIEQILASHPLIEGTSELPILPHISREIAFDSSLPEGNLLDRIGALPFDRLRAIGDSYVDRAAIYRRTDRPFFIDKLPGNWTNVGLIRLILPYARIIDARRHPLATGFSNFKQNYGAGAAFSYDLATIGRYYRDYLRLMTHFEALDGGTIHRVVNEHLIDHFEADVRTLLAYIEVDYDPACLDFHNNRRPVATPSAEQVRRPINRDGVDQWRDVEPLLGPLKQALGPALTGWDLPPGTYRDEDN